MKKLIKIMAMSLMLVVLFSTVVLAGEMTPITEVKITGLDYPDETKQLDTIVKVEDGSYSYFMELNWDKSEATGLYTVTIKTRTYYDYIYNENTIATVNGNKATIIENEESRFLTFEYTFPKQESIGPDKSSSLTHKITVLYLSHGTISPNPIRAPHRKNTTVQIIPDEGYQVKDVLVDGESVGAVTEYTFKKVTEPHKIKAYFEPIPGYVPEEKEEVISGDVSGDVKDEVTYKFEDVLENEWYYEAVQFVCNNKLFAGTSKAMFEPDTVMTRAMIAKVLFNHVTENNLIKSGESANNKFEDVPENEWYTEAVEWAVNTGVTNGTSETTFSPEEGLTREQLVTLLYRYAKAIDMDVSVGENTNILSYDDAFDVSEYAIEAFQWGCGSGVINGKTISTLAPQDLVTRAEVATMMMRFNNIK